MKKIFTLLFSSFILFSCSGDDDKEQTQNDDALITKMSLILYPNSLPYNNSELSFYLQYDNDKHLIKKTGGFLSVSGSTGFSNYFSDKIYTNIVYNGSKATVENFSSSPDFTVLKDSKYYTLNNNQIIQKEVPNANVFYNKKQTFKYINDKVVEILTTLPDMPYFPPDDYIPTYLEKFHYNSNGNLIMSEYFEQRDGVNKGIKIVRSFGQYDNSTNPFKDCIY